MNLPNPGHAHDREQVTHLEIGACFFGGFACRTVSSAFPQFHKTSGQGPLAFSGLNVSFAKQDALT
jgi:hypothetical protein